VDIQNLEAIIRILKQNDVTEFELNNDGTHIKLSRNTLANGARYVSVPEVQPLMPHSGLNGSASSHSSDYLAETAAAIPASWVKVESPIVGTFYGRPGPEKDSFVKEGQSVKKGDTLCIIEAMKLMNEIEAPVSGRIEKILLPDSKVVEYGEILFYINPSA